MNDPDLFFRIMAECEAIAAESKLAADTAQGYTMLDAGVTVTAKEFMEVSREAGIAEGKSMAVQRILEILRNSN